MNLLSCQSRLKCKNRLCMYSVVLGEPPSISVNKLIVMNNHRHKHTYSVPQTSNNLSNQVLRV